MDWIIEQSFTLIYDLLTGQAIASQQVLLLLPLILLTSCFLFRRKIWELVESFSKGIRDFLRLKKLESEVTAKRDKIKLVSIEIEEKIYEINRQTSMFEVKKNEALDRLRVLVTSINENSELHSLKEDINELSKTHGISVEAIKEIKQLLHQIIDISRAEEMRQNSRSLSRQYLSAARSQRAARESKKD